MRLFLTSYKIPDIQSLKDLLGKDFQATKVAVIPNAGDYYSLRAKAVKIGDLKQYLQSLGFVNITVIDLANFTDIQKLRDALSDVNFIWVSGGNTFCLNHEITRTGFNTIIKDLLETGIVYGGESAGAAIAGKNIEGVELADDPRFSESVQYSGLNLLKKLVVPHADSDAFAAYTEAMKQRYAGDESLITLDDNQVLIVDGDNMTVVTGNDNEAA